LEPDHLLFPVFAMAFIREGLKADGMEMGLEWRF
jgi:hypothetical protein